MNEKTMAVLEWDKIKEKVAALAAFSLGKERVGSLEVSCSLETVERNLQLTSKALSFLWKQGEPPFGGAADVQAVLSRARIGGVLDGAQLVQLSALCYCVANMRAYLGKAKGLLDEYLLGLFSLRGLKTEIDRCLDEEGVMKDSASPQLASIRHKKRTLAGRVRDKLDSIIHSHRAQRLLQEPIVTIRQGRYVVPVKQEYKGQFPGIVHDQSGSGATVFVEPAAVVDLNNDLRLAEQEELREIERILRGLSVAVQNNVAELRESLMTLAELDLLFAKAKYSRAIQGTHPLVNCQGRISIKQGRHPLLVGDVVPVDLWTGDGFHVLVITGPNTGGKTVTLKTVGLLTLMTQAGLHIPANEGSEMAIFDGVYADIGDEQSIEQSLSTFSSHMTNIVKIVDTVSQNCLVLLDELGAGTDPVEGAALAMAILDFLRVRKVTTVATTHYSELKHFAYANPEVENASVEFDEATLQPTYRLAIGIPGRSNAFAIAQGLGLHPDVVGAAKSLLSPDRVSADDMLAEIEGDRRSARTEREEATRGRQEYERLKQRYEQQLAELTVRKQELVEEARRDAERMVSETRREMDELVGILRRQGGSGFEHSVREAREQLKHKQTSLAKPHRQSKETGPQDLKPGEQVRIRSLNQSGYVLEPPGSGGDVLVQAGIMKVTVNVRDVERTQQGQEVKVRRQGSGGIGKAKAERIRSELDLRGMMVEEAMMTVDKYLDDAFLSSLKQVRIIHGKGTGALREAIQEQLKNHPHVESYRLGGPSEGGSGVTSVLLTVNA